MGESIFTSGVSGWNAAKNARVRVPTYIFTNRNAAKMPHMLSCLLCQLSKSGSVYLQKFSKIVMSPKRQGPCTYIHFHKSQYRENATYVELSFSPVVKIWIRVPTEVFKNRNAAKMPGPCTYIHIHKSQCRQNATYVELSSLPFVKIWVPVPT
jgi:hypothetical protein